MLEDDAAVGAGTCDPPALDTDRTLLHREEAAYEVEKGAFPATARAEQRHKLALAYLERHVVERGYRAAARRSVDVADPVDDDLRRCVAVLSQLGGG